MANDLTMLDAMAPCSMRQIGANPSSPFWMSAIFKFVLTKP